MNELWNEYNWSDDISKYQMSKSYQEEEDSATIDDPVFPSDLPLVIPKRRFRDPESQVVDKLTMMSSLSVKVPSSKKPRIELTDTELALRRKTDSISKARSVSKCRFTMFFLAREINKARKGVRVTMQFPTRRSSKYGIPYTFDMVITLDKDRSFPEEIVKLVDLSNSMNTAAGKKILGGNVSEQNRKKLTVWRNILYKIAEIIGFILEVSAHPGQKDMKSQLPGELVNGKNLLVCLIDDRLYGANEIIDLGKEVYQEMEIQLKKGLF